MSDSNRNIAPVVAVVGRPNVGKSTLVNVLSGRSVSVVADTPAVTRDRIIAEARIEGRVVNLIDTGGFIISPDDNLSVMVMEQLKVSVVEADIVVCLFDGSETPTLLDEEIVGFLRKAGRPTLYAANKIDRRVAENESFEYHALVPGDIFRISATHNRGIARLLEKIAEVLPSPAAQDAAGGGAAMRADTRILVLGRPNAGKSTFINTVIGADRLIVDKKPGTTRDCVEIRFSAGGRNILLVDSAGVRRPRSIQHYLEEMSAIRAIKYLEFVDVGVLLIDAFEGLVQQDERLAGLVLKKGRGLVVGLNKWDRMRRVKYDTYVSDVKALNEFLSFAPAVPLSGKTGWHVDELLRVAFEVRDGLEARVSTSRLNRFLEDIMRKHPPPRSRGKAVKIYYITQVGTSPPVFAFITNKPDAVAENWKRYAASQLRDAFGFMGVPLRLHFRPRSRAKK
ncbi:MAG: ribosome biogenesis GTPase Der [Pseudomonadota bacterium]